MKKIYNWELYQSSNETSIERYCHNCGKKVIFKDSQKRRHNANGKDIYEYAIYKCDKNHTWNMMVGKYKSPCFVDGELEVNLVEKKCIYDKLELLEMKRIGIKEIDIIIIEITGKWRIDKLLGDTVQDLSRSKICQWIKEGNILIDGKLTKQGVPLKKNQKITIIISN